MAITQAELDYINAMKDSKARDNKMAFANRMGKPKVSDVTYPTGTQSKPINKLDEAVRIAEQQRNNPYKTHGLGFSKDTGNSLSRFFNTLIGN